MVVTTIVVATIHLLSSTLAHTRARVEMMKREISMMSRIAMTPPQDLRSKLKGSFAPQTNFEQKLIYIISDRKSQHFDKKD